VTAATLAAPDPELVAELRGVSRGLPAALADAIEMMRENGSIQLIDQRAYLVRGTKPASPSLRNQLVQAVRELGPEIWSAAKAVAVLSPLGAAVPRLVGEALGTTEQEALVLLEVLCREGIVHRGRAGRSWRLSVPLVASALIAALGPFERRELAAKAVTAVWAGTAECRDPDYFADQVADAGRFVDPQRALSELLDQSASVQPDNAERALRWLGAAVNLAANREQRALVMLMHTSACHLCGDYEQSLRGAQALLSDFADQLSPDAGQEVQAMAVWALSAVGDSEALQELVEHRRRWAGDDAQRTVTRALACGMLDRWREADDLLSNTPIPWRAGNETSGLLGALLLVLARLWTGRPDEFERGLAAREQWPARAANRHRINQVNSYLTALLLTGDLHRAEKLLINEDLPVEDMRLCDRAMLEAMRGRSRSAVDLTRRSVADRSTQGYDPGSAGMVQSTASILVSQGRLAAARNLLFAARATTPMLTHLLDVAEARIDQAFSENERARSRILSSLESMAERGLVIGAETAWAELADLALQAGDQDQARRSLTAIDQVAEMMPTGRAPAQAQLVRAMVDQDSAAADRCLRSFRERGQPFELAVAIERLVRHEVGDPALLSEAYELLGGLEALLYRAWLRNLMQTHKVTVPGRQETVAENEHLLAMLAAEGLSNKQLATVLRTSEKSVEGRLSRLFTHTGYRSRIELSTAMLNGDYPDLIVIETT
jgi:DNA-binding CsgD family transcriptional regulator